MWCVFTGGGGTGATAYANVNSAGQVTSVDMIEFGKNYTSPPSVKFTVYTQIPESVPPFLGGTAP